jgi:hypothetical protein
MPQRPKPLEAMNCMEGPCGCFSCNKQRSLPLHSETLSLLSFTQADLGCHWCTARCVRLTRQHLGIAVLIRCHDVCPNLQHLLADQAEQHLHHSSLSHLAVVRSEEPLINLCPAGSYEREDVRHEEHHEKSTGGTGLGTGRTPAQPYKRGSIIMQALPFL